MSFSAFTHLTTAQLESRLRTALEDHLRRSKMHGILDSLWWEFCDRGIRERYREIQREELARYKREQTEQLKRRNLSC